VYILLRIFAKCRRKHDGHGKYFNHQLYCISLHFGTLFDDAVSVTRLHSVDDTVTSE
jgi:hypothetical protein